MKTIKYSHQFIKDWKKAKKTPFARNIQKLMEMVIANPFQAPPSYEKLRGYENTYSRRINEQHRLVYVVVGDTIEFARCWSHYE